MHSREIALEFQPTILNPPIDQNQAHEKACSNDKTTINHWEKTWLANIQANKLAFGSFAEHSVENYGVQVVTGLLLLQDPALP